MSIKPPYTVTTGTMIEIFTSLKLHPLRPNDAWVRPCSELWLIFTIPSPVLHITDPPAGHPGRHHLPLLLCPGHDGQEGRHHSSLREGEVERHEAIWRPHVPRPHCSHRTGCLPPPHHHGPSWSCQGTKSLSWKHRDSFRFRPHFFIQPWPHLNTRTTRKTNNILKK